MQLVQIAPGLPPAPDGVGGYAAALARGLARYQVTSRFLVPPGSWQSAGALPAEPIGERSAQGLARQLAGLDAATVLLHYANYGYERRGCPAWLVHGLGRWRAEAPSRRLVTMFHEVFATGPPWRSSFWLSPAQRRLAARLLRASDGAATSLGLYARMLARWRPGPRVLVAPVLSPLGEPVEVPDPESRRPRVMLVFGGAGNRRRVFTGVKGDLAAACTALRITEVLDLGPPHDALPERVGTVPVRALGARPEDEVKAVLLRSYAGFVAYPPAFLGKSTVFAAYCAHGLVPVCAWPRRGRRPEAAEDRPPYWDAGAEPPPADAAALAASARAWYRGHDLARQAAAFRALLCGPGAEAGSRAAP